MQYGIGIISNHHLGSRLVVASGASLRARFNRPFAGKRGSMKGSSRRDKHEALFISIGSSS